MSGAAIESVRTCTHPRVKRGVRDLFNAIAELIPEGQTTTPPLTLDELAAQAQHSGRTAQKCRDVLEEIGAIKVHDGGRGKVARYEILDLAGAKPLTAAPLPLLGRPKPRRTKEERSGSDLFSDVEAIEQRSTSEISSDVSRNVGTFFRRWSAKVGTFFRRCAPPWRRLVRARDVQQLKTTTTTAAVGDAPKIKRPPCRWAGTTHAWCDGRVHVPMPFHHEERRKLARYPGETDAELDAQLFARYAEILAGIPDAQAITDANEFVFWKRVLRSATSTARAPSPIARRQEAVSARRTFGAGNVACPHDPMCRTIGECTERILAEGRERQTG